MDPVAVVQRQLDAYNARDLPRFLAEYSEDIRVYRLPSAEPALVGKNAFGDFYAMQRFNRAGLHADLMGRMGYSARQNVPNIALRMITRMPASVVPMEPTMNRSKYDSR